MILTRIILIALLLAGALGLWLYQRGGSAGTLGIDVSDETLVARGARIYAQECASCHGDRLQGQTPNWRSRLPDGSIPAPPHDETGHTWHHTDRQLFEVTKYGRRKVSGGATDSNMPGFEDKLPDGDIWAVLSYIKSRWPERIRERHDEIDRRAEGAR